MKLAIVTSGLFKFTGGPPVVISNLINQLSGFKSLDIHYFGVEGEIHPKMKELDNRVKVNNFNVSTSYRFSISYLKQLIRTNPDVVWVHGMWLWPNFVGILYSFILRKKLLLTPHGVLTKQMFSRKWYKKITIGFCEILALVLKRKLKIHYLSNAERDACILNFAKKKYQIIPNYINVTNDKSISRSKNFVYLARIAPIKGIEDILRLKDFDCDIYGFGDVDYIRKTVINNPNYLGEVESNEVPKIFSKYKYYILPSYGEGLPTSAIEAAMCGCILVVSNQCNLNMFKDKLDCIKFNAGLDNLKEALEYLNNLDDKEIESIRNNSLKVLNKYFSEESLDKEYDKFLKAW